MTEIKLTPAEDLLMQVLIARTRLGEPWWTFDYCQRPTLNRLEAKGLIWIEAAPTAHRTRRRARRWSGRCRPATTPDRSTTQ